MYFFKTKNIMDDMFLQRKNGKDSFKINYDLLHNL